MIRNIVAEDKLTASTIKYYFFVPSVYIYIYIYIYTENIRISNMNLRTETKLFEVSFLHLPGKRKITF